jgi:hypothetical protein
VAARTCDEGAAFGFMATLAQAHGGTGLYRHHGGMCKPTVTSHTGQTFVQMDRMVGGMDLC